MVDDGRVKIGRVFEVTGNMTGDWAGHYSHHGYFRTQWHAEQYTKNWERKNNYHPMWRIELRDVN